MISANDTDVPLTFRPVAEIGPQATEAKGPDGNPAIEVQSGANGSLTQLMVCDSPAISFQYVVRGQVKYEGVTGDGYLELWNDFGDKGVYFSRTLADGGGLKKLNGTSDWRAFELPFYAERGMQPRRLTLNLVLPGAGKVTVSNGLILAPISSSGEWWTMQQAGLVGGLVGALCGVLGCMIGLLAAFGKLRNLTMATFGAGLILGAGSLVAGVIAVCLGQPYHVYYPLLLLGLINTIVLGFNLPAISRRFRDAEIRRMQAVDAVCP